MGVIEELFRLFGIKFESVEQRQEREKKAKQDRLVAEERIQEQRLVAEERIREQRRLEQEAARQARETEQQNRLQEAARQARETEQQNRLQEAARQAREAQNRLDRARELNDVRKTIGDGTIVFDTNVWMGSDYEFSVVPKTLHYASSIAIQVLVLKSTIDELDNMRSRKDHADDGAAMRDAFRRVEELEKNVALKIEQLDLRPKRGAYFDADIVRTIDEHVCSATFLTIVTQDRPLRIRLRSVVDQRNGQDFVQVLSIDEYIEIISPLEGYFDHDRPEGTFKEPWPIQIETDKWITPDGKIYGPRHPRK